MTKPKTTAPTPEFVSVTPELASKWLAHNIANRNMREAQVNKWARDMKAGRWTYTNDAICFAPDGTLLNGQHRLSAIIQSGATVSVLVLHNMPADSVLAMDTGTHRKASDLLGYNGHSNTSTLAAITKQVILLDQDLYYRDRKVQTISNAEIAEFVAQHPVMEHVTEVASRVKPHIDAPPSAVGTAFWLIQRRAGNSYAEYYFDQLASRENEPSGSAVLAVDSRFREVRRSGTKYSSRNYVYALLKGWNHYRLDKRVRTISMGPKGADLKLPEPGAWSRKDQPREDVA